MIKSIELGMISSDYRNKYNKELLYLSNLSKINIFIGENNSGKSRLLRYIIKGNDTKDFIWGEEVCLVYEHCFGIESSNEEIKLSHEHTEFKWCTYEEAKELLRYDSNKNALWELNYKLSR